MSEASQPQQKEDQEWSAAKLIQASYRDLGSPQQVQDRFVRHLQEHCHDAILALLQDSSRTSRDYSMRVDAFELIRSDPILGFLLLRYPATLLPLLEAAIVQAQTLWNEQQAPDDTLYTVKGGSSTTTTTTVTRVHARLVHLPPTCCKPGAALTANDVGKIVQVSGTVVRAGPVQMYESARTYQCCGCKQKHRGGGARDQGASSQQQNQAFCGKSFLVHADLEQRNNTLQEPETCPGTLPDGERCPATKFQVVEEGSVHTDYQEVKIQDSAGSSNHIPRSLLLKLQHDLVDQCQPGDEVAVVGILLAQWPSQTMMDGMECNVSMAMSAHSIRVITNKGDLQEQQIGELEKYRQEFSAYWKEPRNEKHPIAARDFITKSVCEKLYGLQVLKLALLITLIGGVTAGDNESMEAPAEDDGTFQWNREAPAQPSSTAYFATSKQASNTKKVQTRRRDQSHILLVGDPGTGKSQFLRFAAALSPRSVLTTGVGTTSAGLTCAAVREESGKEFALEAGALVLADMGVCCIDEFGCIREADRTTIHEAMEQQTLSIAKAGIVCKLNCRATIVAVMNPRNCLYDNHASLSINTGLGTPLLSRFDLIFKLVDSSDAERDSNVTTYLLNRAIQGAGFDVLDGSSGEEIWTLEKLRAYIAIVKDVFHPVMSDEAALLLEQHYEKCRSAQSNTIPVTVRFLESLIRLSQAHARLMYRNTVTLQDAVAVLQIMECSAFAYGGFDGIGSVDFKHVLYRDPMAVGFVDDPDFDFLCFEYRILERYQMLGAMEANRREAAMEAMAPKQEVGWNDLSQNGAKFGGEDHYGRDQFDMTQGSKRPRSNY